MRNVHVDRCKKVLNWCRAAITFFFSQFGLCGLVVGYCILGAFMFQWLELGHEESMINSMGMKRSEVVTKLWDKTETMVVLMPTNWTVEVAHLLRDYELELVTAVRKWGYDGSDEIQWSFSGALLYSIIVITTIGYGNVAPKTNTGKIVTILYAIVGIPLMLLCMSNIGDAMAHSFKFIYWKICCYLCERPKAPRRGQSVRHHRHHSSQHGSSRSGSSRRGRDLAGNEYGTAVENDVSRSSSYRSGRASNPDEADAEVEAYHRRVGQQQGAAYSPAPGSDGDAHQVPIILNKYVLESKEDLRVDLLSLPQKGGGDTSRGPGSSPTGRLGRVIDDDPDADALDIDYDSDDDKDTTERSVPIWLCLALVSAYICAGAWIFTEWEGWHFLESFYFCFITLTTIGFGDFVPGKTVTDNTQVTLALCALYLLFGMALLAMSFNLVQEQVTNTVKFIGKRIGIIADEDDEE